jgi:hypothetical protein
LLGLAIIRPVHLNLETFAGDVSMEQDLESQMAAIATLLARRVPANQIEADILKQLALFCCAGLLVSVLIMTYGVDLSPGFF